MSSVWRLDLDHDRGAVARNRPGPRPGIGAADQTDMPWVDTGLVPVLESDHESIPFSSSARLSRFIWLGSGRISSL